VTTDKTASDEDVKRMKTMMLFRAQIKGSEQKLLTLGSRIADDMAQGQELSSAEALLVFAAAAMSCSTHLSVGVKKEIGEDHDPLRIVLTALTFLKEECSSHVEKR